MYEIKNDVFYDHIKQYDPDSEYHFVGEVEYHLLKDDKPYEGLRSHREDFKKVNEVLFPHGTDQLDIYEWTTDWSAFFDDGHEWYGACCWSIYDKSMDRYVVMLVSATD